MTLIVVLVLSCNKDKTKAPPIPCDPSLVYFQKDIAPILQSNCAKSGCHDAATHTEDYDFSTYEGALKAVKSGNVSDSKLHKVITDAGNIMPPAPSSPLSAAQIQLIDKWIEQGAQNLVCEDSGACSTSNMSFTNDIKKITDLHCVGCHSVAGGSPGGYDFTTYNGVKAAVSSGKLAASVNQNGAAVAMPPASKLNTCDISKIESWITAGAPNN